MRHLDDLRAEAHEGAGFVRVGSLLEHLDLLATSAVSIGETNASACATAAYLIRSECDVENWVRFDPVHRGD